MTSHAEIQEIIFKVTREAVDMEYLGLTELTPETKIADLGLNSIGQLTVLANIKAHIDIDLSRIDSGLGTPETLAQLTDFISKLEEISATPEETAS